jgi:hypothetical protein
MKQPEINQKVIQMLHDFEKLEAIDASDAWNQALMQQLVESEVVHSANSTLPLPYVTAILIFIVMNAVCIFNMFKNTHQPSFNRLAKLNIISKELLIPHVTLRE